MIKKDPQEIWEWYERLEEFKSSGMQPKEYCDEYKCEYKKFCNMRYRIDYKRETHPDLYNRLLPLGRMYLSSGQTASVFAKNHKIEPRHLSEIVTHIGYIDIIQEFIEKKEEKPMKFIQVPTINLPMPTPQEPEIVEKQNDLEIIISKGVKVSIAPNIDSMKIIKIIELLKDL